MSVYWSQTPSEGVIAAGFRRGYRKAPPRARARLIRASDAWWRQCHPGVSPRGCAVRAIHSGRRHGVRNLVISGLADTIGEAEATQAAQEEESWADWAMNLPSRAASYVTQPVQEAKAGAERLAATGDRMLTVAEKSATSANDMTTTMKQSASDAGDTMKTLSIMVPLVLGGIAVAWVVTR